MADFDVPSSFPGVHVAWDDPDWGPLSRLCEADDLVLGQFMWMGTIRLEDDRLIQAYKHVDTRRYLYLAADLEAFEYHGSDGDVYHAVPLGIALREVFCLCRELGEPAEQELIANEALIDAHSRRPRAPR